MDQDQKLNCSYKVVGEDTCGKVWWCSYCGNLKLENPEDIEQPEIRGANCVDWIE